MSLPTELRAIEVEVRRYAEEYGLDFFETIFEVLDYEQMNQVAAYGGFPVRYPHWRFGMEYERLEKSYAYGLHKIYEMVINNDPCYAYLLECNPLVDQKLVMAHVYGHSDFFKNNYWFSRTNRKMVDQMANHATRTRRYMNRHGIERVESFIDACLSIEDLVDPHSMFIVRAPVVGSVEEAPPPVRRIDAKEYMRPYINPPEFLAAQRQKLDEERERSRRFPSAPQRDVLRFLIEFAPLEAWQRDIIAIIREEAYYFAPQAMTKIMNEGWATYWHSKIMTERALRDDELIDYADHHSGTLASAPGRLNPYKVGVELWRDIEERWNTGRFGKEYDDCEDLRERQQWDLKLGLGRDKIFEVRKMYNDVTFVDAFLDEEFCRKHRLFSFGYDQKTDMYHITSREFRAVKQQLLFQLTNWGKPFIELVDANHKNRGELYLRHRFEGVELREDYARDTLQNLHLIWRRPVWIESVVNGKGAAICYNGSDFRLEEVSVSAGVPAETRT